MAIDSKNLLVWVKAMSRGQALPLDASEVWTSLTEAQEYAKSAIAYVGQTIKVIDGTSVKSYVIDGNYELAEVTLGLDEIIKSYIKDLLVTGSVITYTKGDGTTESFNTTFVGTKAEYEAANNNGKIPVGTFVYITDDEIEDENDENSEDLRYSSKLDVGVLDYMILA